jgi:hypothetical protein
MKGKYKTIFAIFLFIIFFFSMEAQAVDWVLYSGKTDEAVYYSYDPQSIKRVSKDIVRVLNKESYSEKGAQEVIKKLGSEYNGPEYKEFSYTISLWEYNCSEKKKNLLSFTLYNRGGGVIKRFTRVFSSWDFIVKGSVDETLFNIVCKP